MEFRCAAGDISIGGLTACQTAMVIEPRRPPPRHRQTGLLTVGTMPACTGAASTHALICDLLGEDPYQGAADPGADPRRSLAEALQHCAPGQISAARFEGRSVAVAVLADGRAVVLPDACPHAGVPLSRGWLEGNRLVCPAHLWEFELESGRCLHRPDVQLSLLRLPPSRRPGPDPDHGHGEGYAHGDENRSLRPGGPLTPGPENGAEKCLAPGSAGSGCSL
jgi:nitrite reductase/ring-hydroxylating ferredoxin subunit